MSTTVERRFFTAPEVARMMGCSLEVIHAFIKGGQLAALNMARPDCHRRPRYRISEAALAEFEERRTIRPGPAKPDPRPRRRGENEGPY